jgi:MerR family transcriptional regulator, Zn(II)-responsive regulator of zntA
MNVTEFATKTGVSPYAIRYYTRIGLLTPARQSDNRYRRFTNSDVDRLSFIRKAQELGFTLMEIRKVIEESRAGRTPCPLVREIVERRVVENARRLKEVAALQRNMECALERWKDLPDRVPDGDAICHLIETHALHPA